MRDGAGIDAFVEVLIELCGIERAMSHIYRNRPQLVLIELCGIER